MPKRKQSNYKIGEERKAKWALINAGQIDKDFFGGRLEELAKDPVYKIQTVQVFVEHQSWLMQTFDAFRILQIMQMVSSKAILELLTENKDIFSKVFQDPHIKQKLSLMAVSAGARLNLELFVKLYQSSEEYDLSKERILFLISFYIKPHEALKRFKNLFDKLTERLGKTSITNLVSVTVDPLEALTALDKYLESPDPEFKAKDDSCLPYNFAIEIIENGGVSSLPMLYQLARKLKNPELIRKFYSTAIQVSGGNMEELACETALSFVVENYDDLIEHCSIDSIVYHLKTKVGRDMLETRLISIKNSFGFFSKKEDGERDKSWQCYDSSYNNNDDWRDALDVLIELSCEQQKNGTDIKLSVKEEIKIDLFRNSTSVKPSSTSLREASFERNLIEGIESEENASIGVKKEKDDNENVSDGYKEPQSIYNDSPAATKQMFYVSLKQVDDVGHCLKRTKLTEAGLYSVRADDQDVQDRTYEKATLRI